MIWSVPALQDTTIYEIDPYRNTGLDSILELEKAGDSSTSDLYESRILIKFDLTSLASILSDNNIPINSISASLNLYTVQESALPKSYTIEAKALAADWSNGSGYFNYPSNTILNTAITDGATWHSTSGTGSITWSASLSPSTQLVFNTGSAGGGVWYTSSIASQSFNFKTEDTIKLDVTAIVKNWHSGAFTNNGFIIAFNHNQITASNYPTTNIQIYSSDTHTVFEPQLFINWTGSITYNTGSMSVITYEDNPIVYVRSFKGEFLKNKKARILLAARVKYPRPAFGQNSTFATMKALPANSFYQIKDAHNDEIIIPFSQFTKINTNTNGSYFDIYTTMLYAERYYKFEIKAEFSDITEYFDSSDFTFKIIK